LKPLEALTEAGNSIMQELTIDDPVVDWAIDHPESIAVFEKHGIDYCCGGRSLACVCKQRGVDFHMLLAEIAEAIGEKSK
jgi:iron-sulfur cluster repair protein YtfE (RIC family)